MAECPQCHGSFEPRRSDQVYCGRRCRMAHYLETAGDGALRAPVKAVKRLKDGSVSVTLRFAPEDAQNAFALMPGQVIEVLSGVNPLRPTIHRLSTGRPVLSDHEVSNC